MSTRARHIFTGVTRVSVAAAFVGLAMTQTVPAAEAERVERAPVTLPTLDRAAFPGCLPPEKFDGLPAASVVVTMSGDVTRMPFDEAWAAGVSADKADDVWTIGVCK